MHVRIRLDRHELVDLHAARLAHAAEIVALQVDQHDVLCPLLRMRMQLAREREIGSRIRAARSCACDRTRRDRAVAYAHEALGRRADDGDAVQQRDAAERSGIGLAQPAIDMRAAARPAAASRASRATDSPDRCRRRAMYSSARSHGLQIPARIILRDRRPDQPGSRFGQACDASQVVRDARDQIEPQCPLRRSSSARCRARARSRRECESPVRSDRLSVCGKRRRGSIWPASS